ncbi:hypothetical protein PWT90_09075 [Aphanocladium album]|nr:hypothetical protein PWT90_09075 [Aphanocladium album]
MGGIGFSSNGPLLACYSESANVELRDAHTGQYIRRIEWPKDVSDERSTNESSLRSNVFAFSPDGSLLATTGTDNDVIVWETERGNVKQVISPSTDVSDSITTARGLRYLLPLPDLWFSNDVLPTCFSTNGHVIAIPTSNFHVGIFEVDSGSLRQSLRIHDVPRRGRPVCFSRQDDLLAGLSQHVDTKREQSSINESIHVWHIESGRVLLRLSSDEILIRVLRAMNLSKLAEDLAHDKKDAHLGSLADSSSGMSRSICCHQLFFSPDGEGLRCVLSISEPASTVMIEWNIKRAVVDKPVKVFNPFFCVMGAASFDNAKVLLVIPAEKEGLQPKRHQMALYNTENGECETTLSVAGRFISQFQLSSDGSLVAYMTDWVSVHLVNMMDNVSTQPWSRSDPISALVVSPDREYVVSASSTGKMILWRVAGGTVERELEDRVGEVRFAAFSKCGNYLVSFSDDATVRRHNVRTGAAETLHHSLRLACWSLSFSSDGNIMATFSADEIQIWDLVTCSLEHAIRFESAISFLKFSSDNETVGIFYKSIGPPLSDFSCGHGPKDSTRYGAQIWDVASGVARLTLDWGATNWLRDENTEMLYTCWGDFDLSASDAHETGLNYSDAGTQGFTWNKTYITQLPRDIKVTTGVVAGETAILGFESGQVMFIDFDLEICKEFDYYDEDSTSS